MTPRRSKLSTALAVLAPMIVGLMALGAGVRAMNAGLACPDWPLCFGRVIPDFHVGVYFEFIHRAYAGFVALFFVGCFVAVLRSKSAPKPAKILGWAGLALLAGQIVMGGLTVLRLLKIVIVTSHLMLATLFFSVVLWMYFLLERKSGPADAANRAPAPFRSAVAVIPVLILTQITLGGLVASSYAGQVCVDFPLCNGQWAPTFQGALGLQVLHRFSAYAIVSVAWVLAFATWLLRDRPWATPQIKRWAGFLALAVFAQMCVGIANLLLYVPPLMTVFHQSMALAALAVSYRLAFVVWLAPGAPTEARSTARSGGSGRGVGLGVGMGALDGVQR